MGFNTLQQERLTNTSNGVKHPTKDSVRDSKNNALKT